MLPPALLIAAAIASPHSPDKALEDAMPLKRQRLCSSHATPSCSWADEPAAAAAAAAATAAVTPAPPSEAGPRLSSPLGSPAAEEAGACVRLPWEDSFLRSVALRWLHCLVAQYQQCSALLTDTKAVAMAVALVRRVYARRPLNDRTVLLREQLQAQTLLAACLWLALKFEAPRALVPDGRLMAHISGVPLGLLLREEPRVLQDLGWDLMPAAREVGAVGAPDPSGAACEEHKRQLAELYPPCPAAAAQQARRAALAALLAAQLRAPRAPLTSLLALQALHCHGPVAAAAAAAPSNLIAEQEGEEEADLAQLLADLR